MSDQSETRNDANLKQVQSRAQRPKSSLMPPVANCNTNVYVLDSDFGSATSELDSTRFNYIGTSPDITPYVGMCNRRNVHASMCGGFYEWK